MPRERLFGFTLSPQAQRRIQTFTANKRAFYSFYVFLSLFVMSLFAELIANDKPLLIRMNDRFYFPVFKHYTEVEFEIGNIEFEAKGRSVVVERMFRLLLEKIETGKLVAEFKLQDLDDEEEKEEETEEEPASELEEELPPPVDEVFEEAPETPEPSLDPPPAWDTLDEKEPEVSDAEREELGL